MRMVAWCIAHKVAALHDSWELAASLSVSISLPRRLHAGLPHHVSGCKDLLDRIAVRVADAVLRNRFGCGFLSGPRSFDTGK